MLARRCRERITVRIEAGFQLERRDRTQPLPENKYQLHAGQGGAQASVDACRIPSGATGAHPQTIGNTARRLVMEVQSPADAVTDSAGRARCVGIASQGVVDFGSGVVHALRSTSPVER